MNSSVVAGPGIKGTFFILLFFGVLVILLCGGIPPSKQLQPQAVIAIACLVGIAVFLVLFRRATTIDRRAGTVIRRWGSLIVLRRRTYSLGDFSRAKVVKKRKRREDSKPGLRIVYSVELQGDGGNRLRLTEVKSGLRLRRPEEKAHMLKEKIEQFARFT